MDTTYESLHSSFTNFLGSTDADTVATYVDQRIDLREIMKMPDSTKNTLDSHRNNYFNHRDSLHTFDSLHQDTMTMAELQDRSEILDSMQHYLSKMDDIRETWIEARDNELQSWLNTWETTYIPDTMQENERKVVKMYVDHLLGGEWDSTDSTNLVPIATQCPLVGGNAVYLARTLLETKFDTLYSVGSCQGSVPKLTKSKEIKELDVYPNPTRSQLYIEGATPGKMAYIFNQLGRTVDKIEITGKKTQYNTDDLESGIYWIRTPNGVAKFIKR